VEDPAFRVVLEDAELQDQIMTSLFSLDDSIHQAFEHELRKELIGFVKNCAPLFNKMKGQLIEQLMASVRKSFKCFPDDTIKRLQTNLAFGGKDLPEDEFERVLVSAAGAELSAKANQAFHQTVTIASDYLYEKMHDQLKDISDDLLNEINQSNATSEERKREPTGVKPTTTPGATAPQPAATSKPPSKPQPALPPAKKTGSAPPIPSKASKPAVKKSDVAVTVLPKVESNLEHAVLERPAQQGKRPPTRKKRPAPPSGGTAM